MVENTNDNSNKKNLPNHFGRYEVQERIGVGGFASVYSALDPELNSTVAIKVLADNHSANSEVRRRFIEEARVGREIANDRLVNVYDIGQTEDGRPYVVMQLADRGTLSSRLSEVTTPTKRDIKNLVREMATSMTAIHDRSIVHRDIKPSNLLLCSIKGRATDTSQTLVRLDERIVLADLGLARDISQGASGMTVAGGTAGYMAPEQLIPDGKPDHRADLYAASAIIAAISCGEHPERLDIPNSEMPSQLKKVLTQHLSYKPEDRPASAKVWQDELLDAFDHNQSPSDTAEFRVPKDLAAPKPSSWRAPPQPPARQTPSPQPTAPLSPTFQGPLSSNQPTQAPPTLPNTNVQNAPGYNSPPQHTANYAHGPAQSPNQSDQQTSTSPGATSFFYAMLRGSILAIPIFILLFVITIVLSNTEGPASPATGIAVPLTAVLPALTFAAGAMLLPKPRP